MKTGKALTKLKRFRWPMQCLQEFWDERNEWERSSLWTSVLINYWIKEKSAFGLFLPENALLVRLSLSDLVVSWSCSVLDFIRGSLFLFCPWIVSWSCFFWWFVLVFRDLMISFHDVISVWLKKTARIGPNSNPLASVEKVAGHFDLWPLWPLAKWPWTLVFHRSRHRICTWD